MQKRIKFKPAINKIRLNPEQAVLTCDCYNAGYKFGGGICPVPDNNVCFSMTKYTVINYPGSGITCSAATASS